MSSVHSGIVYFFFYKLTFFKFHVRYQMVAVAFAPSLMKQRKQHASNYLPNNGLSEVTGIVADTMFKNTVRLRRIVTPGMKLKFLLHLDLFVYYLVNPVTQTFQLKPCKIQKCYFCPSDTYQICLKFAIYLILMDYFYFRY